MVPYLGIRAQSKPDSYVVVSIEKKTSSNLHPVEFDYWLIIRSEWNKSKDALVPLYIDGFSKTDVDECCLTDTLILFNASTNESFDFGDELEKSLSTLRALIVKERTNVQTIKKSWEGYKEEIKVYLTPIKGSFCICELKHKDDNAKIGYYGKAALPQNGFKIESDFWTSQESKGIRRYDFSELPFMSLQTMQ